LGGRGVEEFVTVQTQNFSFFGKFVTMGGGGVEKVVFLRDIICERLLIENFQIVWSFDPKNPPTSYVHVS